MHWGLNDEPNGWMLKILVVVGLPVMMVLLQLVCVLTTETTMLASRGDEKVATNDGTDGNGRAVMEVHFI